MIEIISEALNQVAVPTEGYYVLSSAVDETAHKQAVEAIYAASRSTPTLGNRLRQLQDGLEHRPHVFKTAIQMGTLLLGELHKP